MKSVVATPEPLLSLKSSILRRRFGDRLTIGVIVLSLACLSAVAATNWQTESRAAYILLNGGSADPAFNRFRSAREMFHGSASSPIAIDLEINMAEALISGGHIAEAKTILNRLKPLIFRNHGGTLLEARYWRRCVKVYSAQKLFAAAAEAQRQVVRLIASNLGDECADCMQERVSLLSYLRQARQWIVVIDVANQLETMLARRPNDEYKIGMNSQLQAELSVLPNEIAREMDRDPVLGVSAVRHFVRTRPYDRRQMKLLSVMATSPSGPQRLEAHRQMVAILHNKKIHLHDEDLLAVAGALIVTTMPQVWDPKPLTQEAIEDVEALSSLVDTTVPQASRPASDLYVQGKSLHAAMLARTNRPDEARQLLDSLTFSPSYFKGWMTLAGVAQARREVVKAYVAAGKVDLARKQFDAIYELVSRHESAATRQKAIDSWKYQEEVFLGHTRR